LESVAIHERVHTADLQAIPTVTADQLAVDEKAIRLHGQDAWLCGAVDPQTDEMSHMSLFPTATKRATRWFLADFHRATNSMASRFSSMLLAISTRF